MNIPFTVLPAPLRGEALILHGHEVLYRTRAVDRAQAVLPALQRAWERGVSERLKGWPDARPCRSPIFSIQAGSMSRLEVVERHPKLPFGDRVLYRTDSEVDADLVIAGMRRAATLGALAAG